MQKDVLSSDSTFDPWWWEAAPRRDFFIEKLPESIDVAIVGSGYGGLTAGMALVRAGRSVLVLDSEMPGAGASSRSGGMCGYGHTTKFATLKRQHGEKVAIAVAKDMTSALEFTAAMIEKEGIDCHFKRTGRVRMAWRPRDYDALARELEVQRKIVDIDADMISASEVRQEVATDRYFGGLLYHGSGGLHPALFHSGLLDRAMAAGCSVTGRTPVTGIVREGDGFLVHTPRGVVRARDVVVATNGYTGNATPHFKRRILPVCAYMMATEPLGEETMGRLIPNARMVVETRSRFCYYRPSPDGERLLFGARAKLGKIDCRRSAHIMHRLMVDIFPSLADVKISHSWTGQIGFSRDNMIKIGMKDGIHYALACNGSGVAVLPFAGYKAAMKVLGSPEGDTPIDSLPFAPILPVFSGRPQRIMPALDLFYDMIVDKLEGSI